MKCRICGGRIIQLLTAASSAKTQSLCESVVDSLKLPRIALKVMFCPACDFYQIPRSTYEFYRDEEYYFTTEISPMQRRYQRWLFRHVRQRLHSPVMEIGPGDGYFGRLVADEHRYVAFEPARRSAEVCREKGLRIINSYFEPRSGRQYRTVICRQVLEHVEDPNALLRGVHASLSDDGYVIVDVPNIAKARILNRCVDFCPEHLSYFTLSALAQCLSRNGLVPEELKTVLDDEYCLAIARKRPPQFTVPCPPPRSLAGAVFWGAGARGVSYCHMMGVRPRYFVDSDPYKVGRFIPSTRIEVRSPESLFRDRACPPVVITGLFYTGEILATLRRRGYQGTVYKIDEDNELVLCETARWPEPGAQSST